MKKASRIFDGLLVLQFRAGDKKALEFLVKRYHRKLYRHAYWYTRDQEASKDIIQDGWQQIIHKIGRLEDPNKFGSWAMTIVRRKSLDYLSRVKKERERQNALNHRTISIENGDEGARDDKVRLLRKAIKRLSDEQQEVLQLFYLEGYSLIEVATILELSVGTVKSRLFHAREKLKSLLK